MKKLTLYSITAFILIVGVSLVFSVASTPEKTQEKSVSQDNEEIQENKKSKDKESSFLTYKENRNQESVSVLTEKPITEEGSSQSVLSSHDTGGSTGGGGNGTTSIPQLPGSFGGVILKSTNCNCIPTGQENDIPLGYGKLIYVGEPRSGSFLLLETSVFGISVTQLSEVFDHENVEEGFWVLGKTLPSPPIACFRVNWLKSTINSILGGEGKVKCKNNPEGRGVPIKKIGTGEIPADPENIPENNQ